MTEKKASIKDVAKLAGVSSATVSHVLNKTRYVSPEVTRLVEDALTATNYKTSSIAKALRKNKTNTIGVMIPDISNPFFATIIKNIESTLNAHGYNIILSHSSDEPAKEKNLLEMLMTWSIDGLIIAPASTSYDYTQIKCPTIIVDRKPENQKYCGVFTDNREILRLAVQRLIDKNHRKIGFISGYPRFSTTLDRLEGYLDALKNNSIAVNREYILQGDTNPESGYALIRLLLEQTDVTAVMIANNRMAIGAMRYLLEHRIPVPQRLAVIAYADYEWSTITNPPLSCIAQPMAEIGTTAAQMLLDKVENRNLLPDQIIVQCELHERSSF